MWTLKKSLKFIRKLESVLDQWGWHCALTGGVLKKGKSKHDLDIIVYPHDSRLLSLGNLNYGLIKFGLKRFKSTEEMWANWEWKGSTDKKHVEVWMKNKRRVDIIIWPISLG